MQLITLTLTAAYIVIAAPADGNGAPVVAGLVPMHQTTTDGQVGPVIAGVVPMHKTSTDGQTSPVIAGLVPFQSSGGYTPPPTTSPGYTPPPPNYTPPPSTNLYGSGGVVTTAVSLITVGILALLF